MTGLGSFAAAWSPRQTWVGEHPSIAARSSAQSKTASGGISLVMGSSGVGVPHSPTFWPTPEAIRPQRAHIPGQTQPGFLWASATAPLAIAPNRFQPRASSAPPSRAELPKGAGRMRRGTEFAIRGLVARLGAVQTPQPDSLLWSWPASAWAARTAFSLRNRRPAGLFPASHSNRHR